MREFEVRLYEDEIGNCPVEVFIHNLDAKMQAKLIGLLDVLKEKGNNLREPYSKYLEDGIFELRCKVGNNITRVLYFFYYDEKIILTNGFVKKTRKTPRKEIKLAKKRRDVFVERVRIQ
ncbi:MAG: type II toxin-antitoxin system RelE/ParE family toxin [Hespellia sp.]|nr:type II toxin-antitoxin system RelE/ParE family toxin [Hespellia sp.]